jgi:hypothetical protein
MGEWPGGVGSRGHHSQCGAQRECLGNGIATGPTAVAKGFEDRVRGRLGQIEFTRYVGEAQLFAARTGEKFDDVEDSGRRR